MHEGKYACAKEDANTQKRMQMRKGSLKNCKGGTTKRKCVQEQFKKTAKGEEC